MRSVVLVLLACAAVLASPWSGVAGAQTLPDRQLATLAFSADERNIQHLELLRQTEDSEARPVQSRVTPGAQPNERVLTFECVSGEYILRGDYIISAPVRIDAHRCDTTHIARMFAAGVVRGRVVAARRTMPPPTVVAVTVTPCRPAKGQDSIGTYRVPAAADGTFQAAVPADCLDLTIGARGMGAVSVPRLSVLRGESRQIGSFTLAPAAVLRVSAQSPAGDPLPGASIAVLGPDEYGRYLGALLQHEPPQLGEQRRADQSGRAVFTLPRRPLTYVVITSGELFGVGGPVETAPGSTTDIGVKVIPRANVRLIAAGDRSWIDPQQRLVVLATPRVSGQWFPAAYRLIAWSDSDIVNESLPLAGTWRFELCLRQSGALLRLDQQTVDMVADTDNAVQFSIGRSRYPGQALVGDTPRAGTIVFVQRDSGEQASAKVDEKGDFSVALARPGQYAAQFSSDDGTVRRATGTAEFLAPDSMTTVRFVVMDISGVVVFSDGSAAVGATVRAKPAQLDDPSAVQEPAFAQTADSQGAFTFRSMGSGDWEISAVLQGRAARSEVVNVTEGARTPMLRLVLDQNRILRGRVVDSVLQPLALAGGWATAEPTRPGEIPAVAIFQTDKQGYFQVMLDRSARGAVQVAVASPGYPAAAFRVIPTEDTAVTLAVPQSGAEVRLLLPATVDAPNGSSRDLNLYALVNDQGAELPMNFLLAEHAASVVPTRTSLTVLIPALAPGVWRVAKFPDVGSSVLYLAGVRSLPEVQRVLVAPPNPVTVDLRKPDR